MGANTNCGTTSTSEARAQQGSGSFANKQRPKTLKSSQEGHSSFSELSCITTYWRENIIFKVQEITRSFFLPPQPYCLKKTSWGRINQNPQTAGEATEPAKAESPEQPVAGPPQPCAPQLLVLNLLPTDPS